MAFDILELGVAIKRKGQLRGIHCVKYDDIAALKPKVLQAFYDPFRVIQKIADKNDQPLSLKTESQIRYGS